MYMKDEDALKLLEIAASLTAATIASTKVGHVTKTYRPEDRASGGQQVPETESVFGDCVEAVRLQFEDLTAGQR